jgi:hypothetical protein
MTKFRSEQILAMNESLFQTTKGWRGLSSPNLIKYVFEYGVTHAIQANEGVDLTEVPELMLDFGYDVERIKQFGSRECWVLPVIFPQCITISQRKKGCCWAPFYKATLIY